MFKNVAGSLCFEPWYQVGESCVRFYYDDVSASTSISTCENYGGTLAQFSSLATFRLLKDIIYHYVDKSKTFWIGAKKLENEKNLMWTDLQMDVSDWVSILCKSGVLSTMLSFD